MLATGNKPLNTYRLSIRVFADGFSLYIYSTTGKLVEHEDIPGGTFSLQNSPLLLSVSRNAEPLHFGKVEVLAATPTTHVPMAHFRREEVASIYRLTFPDSKATRTEIHYEILPSLEVIELFTLDSAVLKSIREVFPDAEIHSLEGHFIQDAAARDHKEQFARSPLHTYICEDTLYVYKFREGQLYFANSYPATNNDDRLYYIIAAWKALQLTNDSHAIVINGGTQELTDSLRKFIHNVIPCE